MTKEHSCVGVFMSIVIIIMITDNFPWSPTQEDITELHIKWHMRWHSFNVSWLDLFPCRTSEWTPHSHPLSVTMTQLMSSKCVCVMLLLNPLECDGHCFLYAWALCILLNLIPRKHAQVSRKMFSFSCECMAKVWSNMHPEIWAASVPHRLWLSEPTPAETEAVRPSLRRSRGGGGWWNLKAGSQETPVKKTKSEITFSEEITLSGHICRLCVWFLKCLWLQPRRNNTC